MRRAPAVRDRLLIGLPYAIKLAAYERAADNINDEVVAVLARHFGVAFVPTRYRRKDRTAPEAGGKTLLRVPPALKRKVELAAVRNRTNQTIEVCRALSAEYETPYEPASGTRAPVGGGRRRDAAAA